MIELIFFFFFSPFFFLSTLHVFIRWTSRSRPSDVQNVVRMADAATTSIHCRVHHRSRSGLDLDVAHPPVTSKAKCTR